MQLGSFGKPQKEIKFDRPSTQRIFALKSASEFIESDWKQQIRLCLRNLSNSKNRFVFLEIICYLLKNKT